MIELICLPMTRSRGAFQCWQAFCFPEGPSKDLTYFQGSRGPVGPPGSAGKRGLVVSHQLVIQYSNITQVHCSAQCRCLLNTFSENSGKDCRS